jgi:hypothetical protein
VCTDLDCALRWEFGYLLCRFFGSEGYGWDGLDKIWAKMHGWRLTYLGFGCVLVL